MEAEVGDLTLEAWVNEVRHAVDEANKYVIKLRNQGCVVHVDLLQNTTCTDLFRLGVVTKTVKKEFYDGKSNVYD